MTCINSKPATATERALASRRCFWDHPAARLNALGALIAMRATSLLLVCLLGLGAAANAVAAGGAAAAGGSNAGAGCTEHSGNSEHGNGHYASSSNGDGMNVPRGGSSSSQSSGNSHSGNSGGGNNMDDNGSRFGSGDASPDGSSHGSSGLSWQSLLPGSIQ